jgi:hypothetical protein
VVNPRLRPCYSKAGLARRAGSHGSPRLRPRLRARLRGGVKAGIIARVALRAKLIARVH